MRKLINKYAVYANHCAIQKKMPMTFHSWKRFFAVVALILGLAMLACTSRAQTNPGTYISTVTKVANGNPAASLFGFGPASSPLIAATAIYVACGSDGNGIYHVYTNYGTPTRQDSGPIPLTCTITVTADPDHDANAFWSVTVNSAQSGTIGARTFTLVSANYQSETRQRQAPETLGGSSTLTIQ